MADYYGSLAEALTYHAARANAGWAASTDPARESALLRASVWLDATYRQQFPGFKTGRRAQLREWPRSDATDQNCDPIPYTEVPIEILSATYEAALRELSLPGSLSPDFVASEAVTSERVGPVSVTYQTATSLADVRPVVSVVDDLLAGLIGDVRTPSLFGSAGRG